MNDNRLVDLMKEIEAGDKNAFQELYAHCFPKIVYHVARNVSGKIADDVAQAFFLRLKKGELPPRSGMVLPWVFTCCDAIAKEFSSRADGVGKKGENAPSPEKERDEGLYQAMKNLTGIDREIVYLHYWEGMRFKEIAEYLSLSYASVGKRHSRMKRKLGIRLTSSPSEE